MGFKTWFEILDNQILFYSRDRDQYGFLSNFHIDPFFLDGKVWPSVEHYYQAMKSLAPEYQQAIFAATTPGKAKRLGDSRPEGAKQSLFRKGHTLRTDWDQQKPVVMLQALRAKFKNPTLAAQLKSTGNKELIEDSPTDSYWGIGNGSGQNMLGKLLMQVRSEL